ncbi:PREDICTED: gibberellin-regulated protein 13-like [Ipomoea nil]|uniref:gibberellin-regulated protein 13-like n=1 Tax=Ipomoea nil TaxID=35883 RepID=UPI0009019850|nr:PREDICTED: gibberellin-regulated protein 13-like [Ipomoea nil]
MALRLTIFLPLIFFLLCLVAYEVSSDPKIEGTEHTSLSQAFHAFTRDNRRLMEDIVLRLSSYLNEGQYLEANIMAPAAAPAPVHPVPLDCGGLCSHRCSLHSRKNVCLRACGTCCARCKCVPPGTSGNREMCGKCYTEMTTHGNRPKCP